jgi:hypothetical protein
VSGDDEQIGHLEFTQALERQRPLNLLQSRIRNGYVWALISLARRAVVAVLIAVRGDPLKDLTLLERVGFVMKGDVVYRDDLMKR